MGESKVKHYKLGTATLFFDGSQADPDNRKIATKEVKPLTMNAKVRKALNGGAIEVATEQEYKEFLARTKKNEAAASQKVADDKKALAEAKNEVAELTEKASSLEAKIADQEAENKALQADIDAEKATVAELEAKVSELETKLKSKK